MVVHEKLPLTASSGHFGGVFDYVIAQITIGEVYLRIVYRCDRGVEDTYILYRTLDILIDDVVANAEGVRDQDDSSTGKVRQLP